MAQLAAGVTITTVAQSDGRAKPLTAPTLLPLPWLLPTPLPLPPTPTLLPPP